MALNLTNEEIKLFIERITGNKDFLYIIQPYGLASVIISGGLSHAVQARKNKSATVMLISDSLKNIGLTWENVTSIKYFPVDTMEFINNYFLETGEYEGENFIYGNFHKELEKKDDADTNVDSDTDVSSADIKFEKISILDQFKQKVFDLPLDTEFVYPTFEKISDDNAAALHEKYILDKNKTVVICPYFDYSPLAAVEFWNDFVKKLTAEGYVVYTNIQEIYQKPLEGTLPLNVSLAELNYLADKVKCFAGIRSGIFDFLAMTGAKIFSVETFPIWQQSPKILYPKCNARTFYDSRHILKPLLKTLAKSNTGAKFTLHHEKITDEDIFYTQKSILTAITDAVQKD